jgi:hypothetical protein
MITRAVITAAVGQKYLYSLAVEADAGRAVREGPVRRFGA